VTEQSKKTITNEELSELSVKKLRDLLSTLVLQENYEKAARVRDELSKRKS
jgi:protein-arginine kinase activator protein McsA